MTATLNTSIINLANPTLAREFQIGIDQVQWISTLYLIIVSSLMLLFGRIGDRVGSYKIYLLGLALFVSGSLCCGLSDSFHFLLAARVIQAVGAAMMLSTGMALVTAAFPLEQRGRALGLSMIAVGLGNMGGPSLGGLILSYFHWSYIFFLNVPFGLIALLLAIRFLRSPVPSDKSVFLPLDHLGALLLAVIISSLILCLNGSFPYSGWFILLFAAAIPLFIRQEKRHPEPLWNFTLLKNQRFAFGNLLAFLSYFAQMAVFFLLPFYMEDLLALPTSSVALVIVLSPLCMAVVGPFSGALSDKIGALRLMPIAFLLSILSFVTLITLSDHSPLWQIAVSLILMGSGMGLLNTPNNSEIMTAAGKTYAGYASGFVGTTRNLAFCFGAAVSASVFPLLLRLFSVHHAHSVAYISALRVLIIAAALITSTGLVICLYLLKHQTPQQSHSRVKM
jgi:EmrB/QacA subfamily drug resistance transporter